MPHASADRHQQLHGDFRWHVPALFNIANDCCTRWAQDDSHADRPAILYEHEEGRRAVLTFGQLQEPANRLSHALDRLGIHPGDRVAIVMPQRLETAIAHMAVYQMGAVAMPLSMLFGPDALEYRLQDSGAKVAIVDETSIANLNAARASCPALRT